MHGNFGIGNDYNVDRYDGKNRINDFSLIA
jgi:hypothetical protein